MDSSSRSVQLSVALTAGIGIGVCIGMLLFKRKARLIAEPSAKPLVSIIIVIMCDYTTMPSSD